MKTETCSCYILLITYILYNKVVLDYKTIYILLITVNTADMHHLKITAYLICK
jgi:hypothetical protein